MIEAIDFRKIPAEERLAHYGLLFALAATDGGFDREEMILIHDVLQADDLGPEERDRLRLFAVNPPAMADCLDVLQSSRDELRHGTMMSLVDVAYADGVLTEKEERALEEVRERLAVRPEQLRAMQEFIDDLGDIDLEREPTETEVKTFAARAAALAATGIPLAAVSFSATVGRILRFGPETLRAALGFGMGKVAGTPISVLVGSQVSVSVSELLHGPELGDDEQRARRIIRRERLQEAIEHLQSTIEELSALIDDKRRAGESDELTALENRRDGLVQLARTRRSALEDL